MFDNIFDMLSKFQLSKGKITPFNDDLYDYFREKLKSRVSKSRYEHTLGVVDTAIMISKAYDVDENKAKLAALLHDWDKCYDDHEMKRRIKELGLDHMIDPFVKDNMPKVMHGLTAACYFGYNYSAIPVDVLEAIANHTIANKHMTGLSMTIYCADALEPNRKYKSRAEIYNKIGKISLHELFIEVYKHTLFDITNKGKLMYPETSKVWNTHIKKQIENNIK